MRSALSSDSSRVALNAIGGNWSMPLRISCSTRAARSFAKRPSGAFCRAANQLLSVLKEERNALERPLEESEQHIATLRKTLGESEVRMQRFGGSVECGAAALIRHFC